MSTPYDVTTASVTTKSYTTSSPVTQPRNINWVNNGYKMFVFDFNTPKSIYTYDCYTAYDPDDLKYVGASLSVASPDTSPTGFYVSPDGQYIFVTGATGEQIVRYEAL